MPTVLANIVIIMIIAVVIVLGLIFVGIADSPKEDTVTHVK